jgi:tail tube protein
MPNQIFSKNQRGYVQLESTFGTIPNSTGTASVGNSNAFLMEMLKLDAAPALIDRPDKNGSLDWLAGTPGRRGGSWSMKASLAGNGAAGTAPDIGPFLQALFGKAPTIVSSTSVTYTQDDLSPSLSIYSFRKPSTATQQVALGAVVDQMILTLGGDIATVEFSGTSLWVLDTDSFSGADAIAKGGLTAFPSEPSAPTTNGNMIVGFKGVITLDGNVYSTVRSLKVTYKANRDVPNDVIGTGYGSSPGQDRREVTFEVDVYDDDSANLSALKLKAIAATTVNISAQAGNVAGNIATANLNNCQLTPATYDDSSRKYAAKLTGKAHASGLGTKDSCTLAWT